MPFSPSMVGMNSSMSGWSLRASGPAFPSRCSSSSWSVGSNFTPAGSPGRSWIVAAACSYCVRWPQDGHVLMRLTWGDACCCCCFLAAATAAAVTRLFSTARTSLKLLHHVMIDRSI
uniref:Uncharacterized protein n=1 Tax=Arundo donax TaxID=35708 RepID=A0A0A9G883_ARUDO